MSADEYPDRYKESVSPAGKENNPDVEVEVGDGGIGGCAAGWYGANCDLDIDECGRGNPCLNGASCINTPGSYTCECADGYTGNNCESGIGGCAAGWYGANCDLDIDECGRGNPCLNGASCINTPGSYTCECADGYTGNNCESGIGGCAAGWYGANCDLDIDECGRGNPCLNGASCINTPGSYTCECADGYTGNNCETGIGGCAAGWYGANCDLDIDECGRGNPCLNGASCINTPGSYTCECADGYTGNNCESGTLMLVF
eukprot:XP_011676762.1 PREDICTED: fibropellin-3-like [Strongylocentrotus purpuratus]